MRSFFMILAVGFIFISLIGNVSAASRIVYEDFDDRVVSSQLKLYDGDTYTWATGYNGAGSSIYFRTTDDPDAHFIFYPGPNNFSSNELYISAWMRFPTITWDPGNPQKTGIKMFYIYTNGTKGYVSTAFTSPDAGFWSMKDRNGNVIEQLYFGLGGVNMEDNQWHKFSIYINWPQGIVRLHIDGKIIKDKNYGTGKWIGSEFYKAHFPSICTEEGTTTYSKQIDEFEVWDGMPSGSTSTTSSSSTTSTTAPPPPGKPYVLD